MEQWKTVERRNPDFSAYLDGSFSDQLRALPVRSLNVDSASEVITFQLVDRSSIRRPSPFKLVWQLIRPRTLVLSMGPMLVVLSECLTTQTELNWSIAVSSFFGVLVFQIAMNLFNDYFDHIRGKDRLSPRGGSRAIQKGWVRAFELKHAAWGLLGLAILFGLPAVVSRSSWVVLVAVVALLAGLDFGSQKFALKYRGYAEILAFALTGPLLTTGYAWGISGQVQISQVTLGLVFGSVSLMYFHAANFENIMPDSQAGITTWATRTGFDASKKFFYFTALLTFCSLGAYSLIFGLQQCQSEHTLGPSQFVARSAGELFLRYAPLLASVIAVALFLMWLCQRVSHLASPLSSKLVGLRFFAAQLDWFLIVVLSGALLWTR